VQLALLGDGKRMVYLAGRKNEFQATGLPSRNFTKKMRRTKRGERGYQKPFPVKTEKTNKCQCPAIARMGGWKGGGRRLKHGN